VNINERIITFKWNNELFDEIRYEFFKRHEEQNLTFIATICKYETNCFDRITQSFDDFPPNQ